MNFARTFRAERSPERSGDGRRFFENGLRTFLGTLPRAFVTVFEGDPGVLHGRGALHGDAAKGDRLICDWRDTSPLPEGGTHV